MNSSNEFDFLKKDFSFKDIPQKREYIFRRIKKIFGLSDSDINLILNNIKIKFRVQEDRGTSNHKEKIIYITAREVRRHQIKTEKGVLKYLEDPRSVILHETMHIFQNNFKIFPHVNYTKENGDIDYEKYVTDKGEVQARVENIIDLMNYGFSKEEIINLLYSRKHKDMDLWKTLVNDAAEIKKNGTSRKPQSDEEDTKQQQDRQNDFWTTKENRGNNYEDDYLSSGHFAPYDITQDDSNFTLI